MLDFLPRADLILGPLLTTFFLGITTLILSFWYSYRKQKYWKERGIPQTDFFPFLGAAVAIMRRPQHEVENERYKKYGKIYGHYEGNRPFLSIAEPEILKQIFVKDFHAFSSRRDFSAGEEVLEKMMSIVKGEDWKRIRTIVTPTFTTGKIKRMVFTHIGMISKGKWCIFYASIRWRLPNGLGYFFPHEMLSIFKDCSKTLVETFKEAAVKGKPVEVKSIYGTFSMDIIASSCFSTKIDSQTDPNNPFVQNAKSFFGQEMNWRIILFLACPAVVKFFKFRVFSPEAMKFFTDVVSQIIEERKKTGQTRNDFLQLLIDTSKELSTSGELDLNENDDIAENYGKEDNQIFKQTTYTKKNLSFTEILAQCIIFFIAGYETTAATLAFASYSLALNPDVQEKLIQEIDDAIRDNNGELTYEAIQSMKYLDNVISETLRLYPPLVRLERTAEEDYFLKEVGMTIPKGMIVTIPIYAMHRDPKLYPDPEKFEPDRFSPEERAKRDQYTYLPFGHGPRNCVGMRFALMEIKVCLASVLSNFRIRRCPETKVPLVFKVGGGFLQTTGITLSFEVRTDAVKQG